MEIITKENCLKMLEHFGIEVGGYLIRYILL